MKVTDRIEGATPAASGGVEANAGRSRSVTLQDGTALDEVRVSQLARALARLITVPSEGVAEMLRTERIEPLREAVARGTYRVDAQATARNFLREVVSDPTG